MVERLLHGRIELAAFATAGLATLLIASDQGGYFERTWPWAGLALAAAGVLALRVAGDATAGTAALALVTVTAAIAAWTALSWLWSSEPPTTSSEALRAPLYLAAAVAFVALASAGGRLGLVLGVAAATTGLATYSLVDRKLTPGQGGLLTGPVGYANGLGALCAIGLVLVVVLGVAYRNPLAIPPAALLAVALALTSSRGAWVAAVAGLFVAAAGVRGRAGRAAALVAAALAVLLTVPAFAIPARLQARGDYWHVGWHVGVHHPLGGTGAGTFDLAWGAFGEVDRWGAALDAHSLYLEMLAELGVVGLLLAVALATPVVAALRTPLSAVSATAGAGAVTFLVHAGLDWDWELPAVTVAGIACLAAAAPLGKAHVKRGRATLLVLEAGLVCLYGVAVLLRKA